MMAYPVHENKIIKNRDDIQEVLHYGNIKS